MEDVEDEMEETVREEEGGEGSTSKAGTVVVKKPRNDLDLYVSVTALVVAVALNLQFKYLSERTAAGTLLGFLGPLMSLYSFAWISKSRLSRPWKQDIRQRLLTFLFAAASAAIVVNYFAFLDLVALNATGAFFDAFLIIFNKVAKQSKHRGEEAFQLLEEFRGTFFGVWTSYSGIGLIAAYYSTSFGPQFGIFYCLITLATSLIGSEAGYRLASVLHSMGILSAHHIASYSFLLPHVAAYVVVNTLVAYGAPGLVACYVFSTLGCYLGAILDSGSLLGPLLNNVVATAAAFAVTVQCSQTPAVCKNPIVPEFVNSFLGASSAYTSTSATTHAFVVTLFPGHLLEDYYYSHHLPGFDSLRKFDYIPDAKKSYKKLVAKTLGDWVFAASIGTIAVALNLKLVIV